MNGALDFRLFILLLVVIFMGLSNLIVGLIRTATCT